LRQVGRGITGVDSDRQRAVLRIDPGDDALRERQPGVINSEIFQRDVPAAQHPDALCDRVVEEQPGSRFSGDGEVFEVDQQEMETLGGDGTLRFPAGNGVVDSMRDGRGLRGSDPIVAPGNPHRHGTAGFGQRRRKCPAEGGAVIGAAVAQGAEVADVQLFRFRQAPPQVQHRSFFAKVVEQHIQLLRSLPCVDLHLAGSGGGVFLHICLQFPGNLQPFAYGSRGMGVLPGQLPDEFFHFREFRFRAGHRRGDPVGEIGGRVTLQAFRLEEIGRGKSSGGLFCQWAEQSLQKLFPGGLAIPLMAQRRIKADGFTRLRRQRIVDRHDRGGRRNEVGQPGGEMDLSLDPFRKIHGVEITGGLRGRFVTRFPGPARQTPGRRSALVAQGRKGGDADGHAGLQRGAGQRLRATLTVAFNNQIAAVPLRHGFRVIERPHQPQEHRSKIPGIATRPALKHIPGQFPLFQLAVEFIALSVRDAVRVEAEGDGPLRPVGVK